MRINKNMVFYILLALLLFLPDSGMKIPKSFFILGLTILFIIFDHFAIKKVRLNRGEWIYAFTFMGSYIIHSYTLSVYGIISFFSLFFCVKYIVLCCIKKQDDIDIFINMLVIIGAVYAILCIAEDITQFNIFDLIFNRTVSEAGANSFRSGLFRGHGFCYVSVNNAMVLFWLWILATYKLYNKSKVASLKYVFAYIFLGLATLLAQSRMVIIVAIICQCLIAMKGSTTKIFKRLMIAAIIVCVILQVFPSIIPNIVEMFAPILAEFLKGETNSNISGVSLYGSGERLALWVWVYNAFRKNMLFGVGFIEQFKYSYWTGSYDRVKTSIEVHWLYVMYQKGLFGLMGFIVYQVACLKLFVKGTLKKSNTVSFDYVLFIGTIGYFTMLFGCSGFEDLELFYLIMALYIGSIIVRRESETKVNYEQ